VRHRLPPLVAERLRSLSERPIEPTEKGFGSLARPVRAGGAAGAAVAWAAGSGAAAGRGGAASTGAPGRVSAASLAAARPSLHAGGFSYPLLTLRDAALR
jgi:hypothetical protein